MATRTTTTTGNGHATLASVTGLLNGDDSQPLVDWPGSATDATIQVAGTFGAGGTLVVEANNDGGSTYYALPTAISITAAGLTRIATMSHRRMRVRVSAGDGTTNLSAVVVARTSQ